PRYHRRTMSIERATPTKDGSVRSGDAEPFAGKVREMGQESAEPRSGSLGCPQGSWGGSLKVPDRSQAPGWSTAPQIQTAEHRRLVEARGSTKWRRWGTYLSERQWGTVREDYSANGDAWNHFTHDTARFRAYRWGEDGLLGLCDNRGLFNFSV